MSWKATFLSVAYFNEIAPTFSLLGVILDMSLVRIPLVCLWCICIHFSSVAAQSRPTVCNPVDCNTHQALLSFTKSWSLLKLMSIELVMPSNHLTPEHFITPPLPKKPEPLRSHFPFPKKPEPLRSHFPFLSLPSCGNYWLTYFLSLTICLFWVIS